MTEDNRQNAGILLVDDEEIVLKILRRLLKKSGFTNIATALNARQALRLVELADKPFAVIVSDQNMPGMNGIDFLARCISLTPDSRRLILTGYSNFKTAMEAVNKGSIHYYMTKPWDNEGLIRVIRQELDTYFQVQEQHNLLSITQNQNARLYRIAATLKEKDRLFQEEIHQRRDKINRLTDAIDAARRSEADSLGLEELLTGNILINSQNLTRAFSLMRSEMTALFDDLAGQTGLVFTPGSLKNTGVPEAACDGPVDDLYPLIDTLLEHVFHRSEPRFSTMSSQKPDRCQGSLDPVADIGELAWREGYITRSELEQARAILSEENRSPDADSSLEKKLLDLGYIRRNDLSLLVIRKQLIDTRLKDRAFAEVLKDQDLVTEKEIGQAFTVQLNRFEEAAECIPIGDILVSRGVISDLLRNQIMKDQGRFDDPSSTGAVESHWETGDCLQTIDIEISEDKTKAWLRTPQKSSESINPDVVRNLLRQQGICFGIIEDRLLSGYLKYATEPGKRFVVAMGREPVHGTDTRINYYFNTNFRKAGIVHQDGTIDFRERGDIPFVRQGTLLAEKIPMAKGRPGRDVFGDLIPAEEPVDFVFKSGKGAELSNDGLQIFATDDGQPVLDPLGMVSVVKDLTIRGDVDYQTGHVTFEGNVIVTGIVKQGFRVRCVHFTASEINGGIIQASGDINISNGIINAAVSALGSVQAKYVNSATLDVFGDVTISREIMSSRIYTSGTLINTGGRVTGSELSARKGFDLGQVGTDRAEPTILKPGCSDHYDRLAQEFNQRIEERARESHRDRTIRNELETKNFELHKQVADHSFTQEKLEKALAELDEKRRRAGSDKNLMVALLKEGKKIKKTIADVEHQIKEIFNSQDRLMQDIDRLDQSIGKLDALIEDLTLEKEAFLEIARLDEPVPVVKSRSRIYSGTRIVGPASSLIVKETLPACRIMEIDSSDPDDRERRQMVIQNL